MIALPLSPLLLSSENVLRKIVKIDFISAETARNGKTFWEKLFHPFFYYSQSSNSHTHQKAPKIIVQTHLLIYSNPNLNTKWKKKEKRT